MMDAHAWGIDHGYYDVNGEWHEPPEWAVEEMLAAMGAETEQPLLDDGGMWIVNQGDHVQTAGAYHLTLEDGRTMQGHGELPSDLPLGYHTLHRDGEPTIDLVVCPTRCHLPSDLRAWGWAIQLYAVRSRHSWGFGDFADLGSLSQWSARKGAGVALLSPLHAPTPAPPIEPSPYYPSSRCFRNPLHLAVADVPGAADHPNLARWQAEGEALSELDRLDRDAVWKLKDEALTAIFDLTGVYAFANAGMPTHQEELLGAGRFLAFREAQGALLARWAAFCVIAEQHGPDWYGWPEEYHDVDATVILVGNDPVMAERACYHTWLQWLIDEQLAAAAGRGLGFIQDLAVGCSGSGADTWLWQDVFARGCRAGAPTDALAIDGQDWGLPPLSPWALRKAKFEPFIRTVRAGLSHGAGLRIDHVMGLFRLFWVPPSGTPADGTYVRYPWQELLRLLALESVRASAFVVGEDLGTVEPWVREQLAACGIMSYRVYWFEETLPAHYPVEAMATITTHDLPTIAGIWTGVDREDQIAARVTVSEENLGEMYRRITEWTGTERDGTLEQAVVGAHRVLAEASSRLVTATLDDAMGAEHRPNLPGVTTDRYPCWMVPLPQTVEELTRSHLAAAVASELNKGRHGTPPQDSTVPPQ